MKRLMIVAMIAMAGLVFADEVKVPAAGSAPAAKPVRRGRPRGLAPSGGLVHKPITGKIVRVVNAQSLVAADEVAKIVNEMRLTFALPFECVPGTTDAACPLTLIEQTKADANVGAVVALVADDKLPSVLVAPETGWSILNVKALAKDEPAPAKLLNRTTKEIWRASTMALGAYTSTYTPCVMSGVASLADLDANFAVKPCPEPFNKVMDYSKKLGINQITFASYRQACREGWAPAPTNDVQKAIFEQIKAEKERGPTSPLKIVPPTQK